MIDILRRATLCQYYSVQIQISSKVLRQIIIANAIFVSPCTGRAAFIYKMHCCDARAWAVIFQNRVYSVAFLANTVSFFHMFIKIDIRSKISQTDTSTTISIDVNYEVINIEAHIAIIISTFGDVWESHGDENVIDL